MTFKGKRDGSLNNYISISILIIAIASLWPVVYEFLYTEDPNWTPVAIMIGLFFLTSGFIVWIWIDVEYSFHETHLFVRGGPFRSKISYQEITKIAETNQVFAGYRILTSKDALEIHYKTGLLGSVIISPENKKLFMSELRKRCLFT